ncbi:MAG TPA: DUF3144 domain-containing protein [Rhodospirillales bacterium]|nr:DUF3144 domain-containing protein [Rhodospirillales bacterium]
MPTEDKPQSHSMTLANEIINLANLSLVEDHAVEEIAAGLRHAAANFSAYCFFRSEQMPKDPNHTVENFVALFEHYLEVHKPKEAPGEGLAQTIARAKEDL